jgi:UDP-2,3-diacylglucosamine pyrophosphatase LpxH
MYTKKIKRVAHIADVHITKNHKEHPRYQVTFDNLYPSLIEQKPERIILVGDLFHDKLNISNETYKLASDFLNNLADIAPLVITRGNHDFNIVRSDRVDCIQTIVDLIKNPGIRYLNRSGYYLDENLIYVVWHHGDHYSPWNELESPAGNQGFYDEEILPLLSEYGGLDEIRAAGYKFIDLFHDPVNGAKLFSGIKLEKDSYVTLDAFKGDHVLMGDIHLRDFFLRTKVD